MGNYQSPGLYMEDKNQGPGPVQAVATGNYATTGWLQRGPVAEAVLVTSWTVFVEKYGSFWNNSYVPYCVAAFFYCGGSRAYINREVPEDAEKASCEMTTTGTKASFYSRLLDDPITSLDDTHYNINADIDDGGAADIDVTGDAGDDGSYNLSDVASNITAAGLPCSVVTDMRGGNRLLFESPTTGTGSELEFKPAAADDCSIELLGHDGTSTYTYTGNEATDRWTLQFPYEGEYGNDFKYCLVGNDDYKDLDNGGWTKFDFVVYEEDADGNYVEVSRVEVVDLTDNTASDYFLDKANADADDYVVVTEGASPGIPYYLQPVTRNDEWFAQGDGVAVEFSFYTVYYPIVRGQLSATDGTESFSDNGDGTLTGDAGGSGTVDYNTGEVVLTFNAAPADGDRISGSYIQQSYADEACCTPTGGADGTGPVGRSLLTAPALETTKNGIYAFNDIDQMLTVSVPDLAGSATAAGDMITWAENQKTRFIVLDCEVGLTAQEHKEYVQEIGKFDTRYAAYYAPQVKIADPLGEDRPLNVPGSGHIAGVYARTAQVRNIAKAPAGVNDGKLNFAIGVEQNYDVGERDIMYPARVNPIVSTSLLGTSVWGCRTLSKDTKWRYVQNVLTYIFVRMSLYQSSNWIVFENNGPKLWNDIKTRFDAFLTGLFDQGYFAGTKPSQGFRVVCDSSINNQDSAYVYCDVYMAYTKPGEFVVLRFAQKTVNE